MEIIVDSREQDALIFKHPYVTGIKREKLNVGDYGVEFQDGHRPAIYFERKSIGDLYGTTGSGYKRFKREIQRAKDSNSVLLLIVEGTLSDILKGTKYTKREGSAVVDQLMTLWTKYNLYPIMCDGREECAEFIARFFVAVGKLYVASQGCVKPPNAGEPTTINTAFRAEGTQEKEN